MVKKIFNYIRLINPTVSVSSSLGSYVTSANQQVADNVLRKVIVALPKDSLAYKIATSNQRRFTDKQLWVLAFELVKNADFAAEVEEFYSDIEG